MCILGHKNQGSSLHQSTRQITACPLFKTLFLSLSGGILVKEEGMEPVIDAVKKQDFLEILPLFKQLWPSKVINTERLNVVFDRGVDSTCDELFCVKVDNKIIGFAAYAIVNNLWQEGQISYVYAMVVDEKCRGKGYGAILLKEIIRKSEEAGYKRIELDSGFPREQAHKFYEKIGFEKRAYLFSKKLND